MFGSFFIEYLFSSNPAERFLFFATVLVVVVSIVLHELAHGWAAIRLGDDTPIRLGRMTGNPLVHMGPFSLLALALVGLAWGQMPIDSTRLRGKRAESLVALAGPAVNLVLGIACLTALALWVRFAGSAPGPGLAQNGQSLLEIGGLVNLALLAFNLLPIPPLDGSHVASNFFEGYRRFVSNPANQGALFLGFAFAFIAAGPLIALTAKLGLAWKDLLAG